ncbi:MAG: formamidopyrimidine-DNA glycosylase [Planctomycetaceae bacterium]|nr:formamidopyrimidine-DNA glycosylase [Planctomycetaceae bacterium]
MPELPEVETMCRSIAAAAGGRIGGVERPKSRLQSIDISPRIDAFRRRIVGRRIQAIRRVGKRVVLELEECPRPAALPEAERTGRPDRIVLEPRMTGLVLLRDPPDREHVRFVLSLADSPASQIIFWDQRGLGVVHLLRADEFFDRFGPTRIGPDALEIDCETLQSRLGGSRRAIKVALLDQRALAGVGNLYASEILHLAGVHPATPCQGLRPKEWSRLHDALRQVLRDAIRHQGSTLRDGTYRVSRDSPAGYQRFHRVYQRTGEVCLQCGAARIVRIVQSQRSTFFCPRCQAARRR